MADATQSNPKAFMELNQRIEAFAKMQLKVGWFEDSVYENGRSVAEVAAGNELGIASRKIPPRPFMRPTATAKEKEWANTAGRLASRVLDGKMAGQDAMDILGTSVQADIVDAIKNVKSPPLSPITLGVRAYKKQGKEISGATIGEIARKIKEGKLNISGVSDAPLNDTGFMIATLSHVTEGAA